MRIRAFTLAEVLITIGIIGTVAALTIPTLISNVNSQHYKAMFKKSIATLNQAGRMSQAKYEINYGSASAKCGANASTENPDDTYSFCAILNGTLSGARYVGALQNYTIQMYESEYTPEDMLAYTMSNGSMVMFSELAIGCTTNNGIMDAEWIADHPQCLGYIDVNANTKPNKIVSCDDATLNISTLDTCYVSPDKNHTTDVYPVIFYDGTVEAASPAARGILISNHNGNVEATAVLNAHHGNMCDATVNGCNPCKPCYRTGFDKSNLTNKIRESGFTLRH